MNEINIEAAAQALYGSTANAQAKGETETGAGTAREAVQSPAIKAAPSPDAEIAEALYAQAEPDATVLNTTYGSVGRVIEAEAIERLGLTSDDAKTSAAEWKKTFNHYGVSSSDAEHLAEIGIAALANGVDDAKAHAWANESRTLLSTEFGQSAALALDSAKRLVAADPALAAWLDQTGLGDHPKVVATIAKRAWQLRSEGRLK